VIINGGRKCDTSNFFQVDSEVGCACASRERDDRCNDRTLFSLSCAWNHGWTDMRSRRSSSRRRRTSEGKQTTKTTTIDELSHAASSTTAAASTDLDSPKQRWSRTRRRYSTSPVLLSSHLCSDAPLGQFPPPNRRGPGTAR
jgi:hypothetical protein